VCYSITILGDTLLKKSLAVGIIILFVGASSFLNVSGNENLNEQLDQYQTQWEGDGYGSLWLAQSFKPTLNILTSVNLPGWRDGYPSGNLWVSIKEELNGECLTSTSVSELSIPIWTPNFKLKWTKFDFPDIAVEPEKRYFIVWHCETLNDNNLVGWLWCDDDPYDQYERGSAWDFWGDSWAIAFGDFCFKTYGYNGTNLNCNGDLRWTDVKTGSTVSGSFTVENSGGPGTELDWEIGEHPNWGTWSFTPNSGNDLTPEDGAVIVQVSVIAPNEEALEFYGNIIIRNNEFPNTDWELLSTSLIEINNPPDIPTIDGVTSGRAGIQYEYSLFSLDSDGDNVYYCINWSDGTEEMIIGPYESGIEVTANHTWNNRGKYTVKVKAIDTHNTESDWATLEVSMPKNKIINPFERFLENHPYMFPLLRQLLGL